MSPKALARLGALRFGGPRWTDGDRIRLRLCTQLCTQWTKELGHWDKSKFGV